jgi:Protein of unknown function (DUF2927)
LPLESQINSRHLAERCFFSTHVAANRYANRSFQRLLPPRASCDDEGAPHGDGRDLRRGRARGFGNLSARAENPEIASRRTAERTDFTNDEIREGFFKIAFGAELQIDTPAGRVRKFDKPVRIFVEGSAPGRRRELAGVVADIRSRINHLDIAITNDRGAANFTVRLVPERKLKATIRALYGKCTKDQRARAVAEKNAIFQLMPTAHA